MIMTTFNNISANGTFDSSTWLLQFSLWPLRLVCPLLFIVCPIANWMCISVFQSPIYHRSSSKWYFIFIAIFDTIYVLVTAPLMFLLTMEIYILNWNIIFCKGILFLNYLSCQISAGLLACLSIDRLLATTCLFLYRYNCTTSISKYVCIFVIIFLSLINSHYLIGYTIDEDGYCSVRHYRWYQKIYSNLNVVYLLSYSIVPFTIIAICNVFIVTSVCHTKSNMTRKYLAKKPASMNNIPHDQAAGNAAPDFPPLACEKIENGLRMERCSSEQPASSKPIESNCGNPAAPENRLSEKLLLDADEAFDPNDSLPSRPNSSAPSSYRPRSSSNRYFSSSPTYSQKICIQLQITLNLLAISICFIFCTLPNCISLIMIQIHNENDQVRKFWQAMNYFSIVPLLITHSVNLVFYYLSSNMFRNQFKEDYFRESQATKQTVLKAAFKS